MNRSQIEAIRTRQALQHERARNVNRERELSQITSYVKEELGNRTNEVLMLKRRLRRMAGAWIDTYPDEQHMQRLTVSIVVDDRFTVLKNQAEAIWELAFHGVACDIGKALCEKGMQVMTRHLEDPEAKLKAKNEWLLHIFQHPRYRREWLDHECAADCFEACVAFIKEFTNKEVRESNAVPA